MNVRSMNDCLLRGELERPGLFPHLENLEQTPIVFDFSFGLDSLPLEPGILIIRGARQIGKSTWLETQMKATAETFGPGHALYLNGDELRNADELAEELGALVPLMAGSGPRRVFVDEISAVPDWERGVKRLVDAGELRDVLLVTTGSRATDLRRGSERLPGRKGRLARTDYLFLPVSYVEFRRRCGRQMGASAVVAYLLSGGSPVACNDIVQTGRLSESCVTMVRDWVLGDVARDGRSRSSLMAVMDVLHRFGGTPVGQAKLAREAGLANNTVGAGYIELLADLLCVGVEAPWNPNSRIRISRSPAKYPFVNLLAALTWAPSRIRTVDEFNDLTPDRQGIWLEWLVAQELWRRGALAGVDSPEQLAFWQSKERELDFMVRPDLFVEVKRGSASPTDFAWFPRVFPNARLMVVNATRFRAGPILGVTMEEFLAVEDWDDLDG